jgi:hypothetical protein
MSTPRDLAREGLKEETGLQMEEVALGGRSTMADFAD